MASIPDWAANFMDSLRQVNNPFLTANTETAKDYYNDPYGFARKQGGMGTNIDQVLVKPKANVGLGGMFGAMPTSSDTKDSSVRNAIQEREDALRAANLSEEEVQAIMAAEQEERGSKINSLLTLLTQGVVPTASMFGIAKYGPTGYMDYLQGNMRNLMGDKSGYISPNYTPKPAGVEAPVVSVPFASSNYYTPQDTSSYSDYSGAGQEQMDNSLQSQSDYYG